MAKAMTLTADVLKAPQITPKAATPARRPEATADAGEGASTPAPQRAAPMDAAKNAPKGAHVPLQVRIPKDAARAIKVAAAERDLTISDFVLTCVQAYMGKTPSA